MKLAAAPAVQIERMIACLEAEAARLIERNEVLAAAGWPMRPDDFELEQAAIFSATATLLRRILGKREAVRAVLEADG